MEPRLQPLGPSESWREQCPLSEPLPVAGEGGRNSEMPRLGDEGQGGAEPGFRVRPH